MKVKRRDIPDDATIPQVLTELERLPGLVKLDWKSVGPAPS
jgi:hypothetical protein